ATELEEQGSGEGEDAEPTNFESVDDVLRHLSARLEEIEDERERADSEAAMTLLEERVEQLVELNEQLTTENSVLAKALKELSAKTKTTVSFAPGQDGGYQHNFQSKDPATGRPLTQFEARVEELVKGGKEEADAILFAINEDQDRYDAHL